MEMSWGGVESLSVVCSQRMPPVLLCYLESVPASGRQTTSRLAQVGGGGGVAGSTVSTRENAGLNRGLPASHSPVSGPLQEGFVF